LVDTLVILGLDPGIQSKDIGAEQKKGMDSRLRGNDTRNMKKEPSEKQSNISYKIDVKDFIVKGVVGDRESYNVEVNLGEELDEENTLKSYKGKISLTMLENEIYSESEITYTAETICARCLKKFERHGEVSCEREYKIGKRVAEDGEFLVDKEFKIEVGVPIYEEIMFDIPMKPVCNKACKGFITNNK